jgi:hypothetical protein
MSCHRVHYWQHCERGQWQWDVYLASMWRSRTFLLTFHGCAYRRLDLGDRASHGRVSGNDDDDDDDDDSSDRERQDRCEVHRLGMWLRGDRGVSLACP